MADRGYMSEMAERDKLLKVASKTKDKTDYKGSCPYYWGQLLKSSLYTASTPPRCHCHCLHWGGGALTP